MTVYIGDDIRIKWVNSFLPQGKGKILDIGCGPLLYQSLIKEKGWEWYGIDLYDKLATEDPRFNNYTKASATNMPFDDLSFDGAIMVDVLEHIQEDEKALREVYRVLKHNGFLIIHVPQENQKHIWGKVKHQEDHVREGYSTDSIFKLLQNVGFNRFRGQKTFMHSERLAWDLFHFKKDIFELSRLDPTTYNSHENYGLIYHTLKEEK